jgi:hypothetical protein
MQQGDWSADDIAKDQVSITLTLSRDALSGAGAEEMPRILHLVPVAKPEDTASFAWYLARDECPVVTGGVFPIDSGCMAQGKS